MAASAALSSRGVADEYLFGNHPHGPSVRDHVEKAIRQAVEGVSEDELLSADAEAWAEGLARDLQIDVPGVRIDQAEVIDHGAVQVDATGMAGVTYSSTEWGRRIIRDGRRLEVRIPAVGDPWLLKSRPSGDVSPIPGEVERDGSVVKRVWEWPLVKGTDQLNNEIETWKNSLERGADKVAEQWRFFNSMIKEEALKIINERREYVLKHRDFLGGLSIPVKKRDDAPHEITMPPVRPRPTPSRRLAQAGPPPDPVSGSQLDELYEQTLDVIRSMSRGLERSPGSFRERNEETLRDHLLATLNSHFVGQAFAEAFNKSGKTDILIRVQDRNVFIAECKWWDGPKKMAEALEQLYGYTTWRDSRLALIFFVRAKDISRVITAARELIVGRDEYLGSAPGAESSEIRCRVRWPDDEERQATLTVQFVHLPGED